MKGTKHTVYSYPDKVAISSIVDRCIFETPLELASFIEELREAGRSAFGNEMIEFPITETIVDDEQCEDKDPLIELILSNRKEAKLVCGCKLGDSCPFCGLGWG